MKHSFSSFPKVVTTVARCKIPFKSASQALSRIQQEMQTVRWSRIYVEAVQRTVRALNSGDVLGPSLNTKENKNQRALFISVMDQVGYPLKRKEYVFKLLWSKCVPKQVGRIGWKKVLYSSKWGTKFQPCVFVVFDLVEQMCVLFKTWIGDLIATKKVRCVHVSILGTICNALFWPVTVLRDNGMKRHTIGCQPGHLDLEYSGSQRGVICLVPGKTVASKHCLKHSNKFKQIQTNCSSALTETRSFCTCCWISLSLSHHRGHPVHQDRT